MKDYEHVLLRDGGGRDECERISFLRSHDVITLSFSIKITGTTVNEKSWTRWRNTRMLTVSTRARGSGPQRINIYQSIKKTGVKKLVFKNVTPGSHMIIRSLTNQFTDFFVDEFNSLISRSMPMPPVSKIINIEDITHQIYPMLKILSEQGVYMDSGYIPSNLSIPLRQNTAIDFINTAFGASRYRKDLVKAITKADLGSISVASALSKSVPIDYLIKYLYESQPRTAVSSIIIPTQLAARDFARLMKYASPVVQQRLIHGITHTPNGDIISDDLDFHLSTIKDTIRMHSEAIRRGNINSEIYRVKDWEQLHDRIAILHSRMNANNTEIPQSKKHVALDGITHDDITVITAKDTHTLVEWGAQMGNCISSYSNYAIGGDSILAAAIEDGKMVANIEISRDGTLRQLLGRQNRRLSDLERKNIINAITSVGVVKKVTGALM